MGNLDRDNEYKKQERSALDKIREQRQICGEIFAGVLYHGFRMTEKEERFVKKINRSMKPVKSAELAIAKEINERRWGR